jgi:flagella basal body P-ring formation protein FlgA
MRITLRVICLENGARGERVRVSSTDHKRIYQAEVIDPGLLKSAL